MPIYAFRCGKCHYEFEFIGRVSERDEVVCPECGATREELSPIVQQTTFKLKGNWNH